MFSANTLQPCHYLELESPVQDTLGAKQTAAAVQQQGDFSARVQPQPLINPALFHLNQRLATELGLSPADLSAKHFSDPLSQSRLPEHIIPIATVYSGHQFGQFNPTLGDGRAMLIGDRIAADHKRWEIQLKGSGPTPYSRGFDGRAVLRSVIREYLASEAMAALAIPTTRALCIVNSQTPVIREQREQAALMIRTAASHLRFGSFEHFTARNQLPQLQRLADFCIEHHFPELQPQQYHQWFTEIIRRTARLMAQWQAVGFCHGVMNTDNFSILGLTIDYGPYGFIEQYDPGHICNHSDHQGRYAFERQPGIGYWNCLCLARALSPLIDNDQIQQALSVYEPALQQHYLTLMRLKLGLVSADVAVTDPDTSVDEALIAQLLVLLTQQQLDYSRFFRGLGYWLQQQESDAWLYQNQITSSDNEPIEQTRKTAVDTWLTAYRQRLNQLNDNLDDSQRAVMMAAINPKYILRNYLAQQAIEKAEDDDPEELDRLLQLLQQPYDEHPQWHHYAEASPAWAAQLSISCSS